MNDAVKLFAVGFSLKRVFLLCLVTVVIVLSLPVVAVFSLGTPTVTWLANKPDAKTAETMGFYMGGPVEGNTYAWGNCTWWTYSMRLWAKSPIPNTWGNANTWDDYARREGYTVNHTPAVGAIFQTDRGGGGYGHVAYVVEVRDTTGDWIISEMNAPTLNVVSTRTFAKDDASMYNFIHAGPGDKAWGSKSMSSQSLRPTGR